MRSTAYVGVKMSSFGGQFKNTFSYLKSQIGNIQFLIFILERNA